MASPRIVGALFLLSLPLLLPTVAAQEASIDSGDTAWMLVASALVMLMTPGLALFYGGMVRRKNVLGTMMHSFVALGLVTILWVVVGYSLAFGTSVGGIIGGLDKMFLSGVSMTEPFGSYTISEGTFMIFQMMFAIITPALLLGAVAERMRFRAALVFIGLWSLLVYAPLAHWVWGGGWLATTFGSLDFAGGLVVHISSGVGALAAALYLGHRKGFKRETMSPHNLPLVLLGAALLWFGWFGFNAGSALAANGTAVNAFVVTHIATAAAALCWAMIERAHKGKATALGYASGAVAGLVAITPACGFVGVSGALLIGGLAGLLCYGGVQFKNKLGFDDSLDAWGIHGVGGTWGAIGTGLFATAALSPKGAGLFISGDNLGFNMAGLGIVTNQLISVAIAWAFAFIMTGVILVVIDKILGVRLKAEDEEMGLDATQHGEAGYDMGIADIPMALKPAAPTAKSPLVASTAAIAGTPSSKDAKKTTRN